MQLGTASRLVHRRRAANCGPVRFRPSWDAGVGPAVAELWAALPGHLSVGPGAGVSTGRGGRTRSRPSRWRPCCSWRPSRTACGRTRRTLAEYLAPRHPSWAATLGAVPTTAKTGSSGWSSAGPLRSNSLKRPRTAKGGGSGCRSLGRHLLAGDAGPGPGRRLPARTRRPAERRRGRLPPGADARAHRQAVAVRRLEDDRPGLHPRAVGRERLPRARIGPDPVRHPDRPATAQRPPGAGERPRPDPAVGREARADHASTRPRRSSNSTPPRTWKRPWPAGW